MWGLSPFNWATPRGTRERTSSSWPVWRRAMDEAAPLLREKAPARVRAGVASLITVGVGLVMVLAHISNSSASSSRGVAARTKKVSAAPPDHRRVFEAAERRMIYERAKKNRPGDQERSPAVSHSGRTFAT